MYAYGMVMRIIRGWRYLLRIIEISVFGKENSKLKIIFMFNYFEIFFMYL